MDSRPCIQNPSCDPRHWLERGESDASLLYDIGAASGLKLRPLLEEDLWIVDRLGNVVRQDVPVELSALSDLPLVLPDARHGLRVLIDHKAALAGVRLRVFA